MKRRDFLKSPAIGIFVPGAITLQDFSAVDQESGVNNAGEKPDAQRFEQKMHPDFMTYMEGIEYFYLGNGDIQGAVQYSPKDSRGTFLGFTLMDPENFCRKWSTFLYHPERGLANTKLGVTIGGESAVADNKSGMYYGVKGYSVTPENFISIQWKYVERVPVVSVVWRAGECEIEEEYFTPSEGAVLFRRVNVKNLRSNELKVTLSLSLYANFGLFTTIHTDDQKKFAVASGLAKMKLLSLEKNPTVAGRYDVRVDLGKLSPNVRKQATYVYAINDGETIFKKKNFETLWKETATYWGARSTFETGRPVLDRLFNVSRTGLKSAIARSGRNDAGIWQYNMEWLFEQVLAMEALLRAGFVSQAKVMLGKNLKYSICFDGRTIESSRWFGFEYTELVQNGILLYEVWVYLSWTGDYDLIKKYWNKVRLCGNFPLMEVFLDPQTKMVKNKREFWERSDSYGVENGYELAYQFWVSFGLEKGALVAAKLGDKETARRWSKAAEEMKQTMFNDSVFKFIEDGHLIKRRTIDGRWQKNFIPPDRKRMPPGSPIAIEEEPSSEPDTVEVFPIVFEMIDPRSELSSNTLQWVEQLWDQRWDGGGYPRYNVTSEDNPPAPWPIPSVLVARAHAAAGNDEKVWRVLNWLYNIPGGKSGSLFERMGQSITPPMPPVGVNGWVWYELIALCIHHLLGFRPELDQLLIRPHVLKGLDTITSHQTLRGSVIDLKIRRSTGESFALINGKKMELSQATLKLPFPLQRNLLIEMNLAG